jgi:hypothetical protein
VIARHLPIFFTSEQLLKICKIILASVDEKLADSAARSHNPQHPKNNGPQSPDTTLNKTYE